MKFGSFKNFTIPEMVLLLVFIVYILFPIGTPNWMKPYVQSSVGFMALMVITLCLFVYTNPALGVVYIFVAYEMIRRSSVGANYMNTPSVERAGKNGATTSPPSEHTLVGHEDIIRAPLGIPAEPVVESPHRFSYKSLEEEVVEQRAPIGISSPLEYTSTSFVPVAPTLKDASLV